MAKELNETFPGIEAVNDFYTPYYMKEYFPDEVKNASAPGNSFLLRNAQRDC